MALPTADPLIPAAVPGAARLAYWALLLGLLIPGLNIAAAAYAWQARSKAGDLAREHFDNQISIVWRSVIYLAVGLVLTYFLFGVLLIMATIMWYILRILKGLRSLSAGLPPENPQSWLF